MEIQHYAYVYKDPRDGVPFYVGKGKEDRYLWILKVRKLYGFSERMSRLIASIRSEGLEPVVEVVNCENEDCAYLKEAELIRRYGRVNNHTDTLLNKIEGPGLENKNKRPLSRKAAFAKN